MASVKRKRLSIQDKINVIAASEEHNLSVRKLAEKFSVGKTQVSDILKNKTEIKELFEKNGNLTQKRKFPKTDGLALDDAVFNWFCKVRNKNIPISGPLLKEKALEAAQSLNLTEFKASNGWLEKFSRRHRISFKTVCGESANVNLTDVDDWKVKLQSILKDYAPKDVFNADETGLFFRALPTKTFALRNDRCAGGKSAKERLTILLCSNMEGDKEKPLVIGKSKKPRCFAGAYVDKLPIEWVSNKKAWMTLDIMSTWLKKFDSRMKREKRSVILFLDNATSHPKIALENVKLIFLPPNTTSYCQPLDQGIIQNFKVIYRSMVVKRLLALMDSEESLEKVEKSITVANALIWISAAWKKLSPVTVKNCFAKCGFTLSDSDIGVECDIEDDIPLAFLFPSFNITNLDLNSYSLIDNNLITENSNVSIIDCIDEVTETSDEIETDNVEGEFPTSISSITEAHKRLKDLENYFLSSNNFNIAYNISQILIECESEILTDKIKKVKQTTITDYFK